MWRLAIAVLLVASRQVRCQTPVEPEEEFYLGTVVSEIIPITEPSEEDPSQLPTPQPDCSDTTSINSNTWELSKLLAATSSPIFYILFFIAILYLITVVGCIKCILKTDGAIATDSKHTTVYHGVPTCTKESHVPQRSEFLPV